MTRRSLISTLGAAALSCAAITAADLQTAQPAPVHQFKAAVCQYAQVHRAVEQQLPLLRAASDARDIVEHANAMAAALQTARAQAREGDIFTADIAAEFRKRISDAFTAHGFLPDELIASSLEEADEAAPLPVVNGRFPWGRGALVWPGVLHALPPLPDELQYRFIGRDLVLLDTHADLVIDILRNAIR